MQHQVVSREEWLAARKRLLAREKAFTRLRDVPAGGLMPRYIEYLPVKFSVTRRAPGRLGLQPLKECRFRA